VIGNDVFVRVFGSTTPGEVEMTKRVAIDAIREGFHVVIVEPGGKKPACILNTRDRKTADVAAQSASREAGNQGWQHAKHACSYKHTLNTEWAGGSEKVAAKVGAVFTRIQREHGGRMPNLAVLPGPSGWLAVDVDTVAQDEAFQTDWAAHGGAAIGMTVRSPGKIDRNGEWAHKGGGHYWFRIPEGMAMPTTHGEYHSPNGWVAIWDRRIVLVPPSTRAEGPYVMPGAQPPGDVPSWLRDELDTAAPEPKSPDAVMIDGTASIDQWAACTPWAALLEPDGWNASGKRSQCGCPDWTAPGSHGSDKSATAHEPGCGLKSWDGGHAPLHVWTDNPPAFLADYPNPTKPRYLAQSRYGGSIAMMCEALGLPEPERDYPDLSFDDEFGPAAPALTVVPDVDEFDAVGDDAPAKPELTRADRLRAMMVGSAGLDSLPEPESLVAGFLDIDSIARMTGKSGHGKSFVMLDMSACVATGKDWHGAPVKQGLVVYMVAEGVRGWKRRVRAWESRHNDGVPIPDSGFLIIPFPIQSKSDKNWPVLVEVLTAMAPALIVFDTQARITVGIDENDATAMGEFVDQLEKIRRATGACVIAVHHLGHQGEHGRGSTAVLGALGSEIRVIKTSKGHLTVETEKQKDDEEHDPLKFVLDPEGESVVPMPDGWTPGDVFDPAPVAPEAMTDSRLRMSRVLWDVFSQGEGATRAELRTAVAAEPDSKPISKTTLYRIWNDMVRDRVLEQQLNADGKPVQRWKLTGAEAARLGLNVTDSD
jgi:hypothetical protein